MPLALKSKTTINTTGSELYIEFVEATGDYDEVNNPGGFGGPNPQRNTLAVFLYAMHKKVAGDVPAAILDNNPLTVTAFTITLTRDVNGVLFHDVVALPIFSAEGTYEDGNVVYDNTDPLDPFIKEMVAGVWTERTLDELVGNVSVYQISDYAFPIPDAIAFGNSMNAQQLLYLQKLKNKQCGGEEFDQMLTKFLYVDSSLKASTTKFCNKAFNQAQIGIENLFEYQSSL